ncbi:MAG TPA: hypothetical protein VF588_19265 [Pyrinomonadaceae bacterium]|jgi:hypothetical protein
MSLTKKNMLAGSILLALVVVVGADLGLVGSGVRRVVGLGLRDNAVASVSLRVEPCV